MPNWCMNSVTITGDADTLKAIADAAKEGKLLEYLAPIGEWEYGKAVDTWGTKWDIDSPNYDLDLSNNTLFLSFDSAWAPPTSAYAKACETYDITIEASYYEPGMCFVGMYDSSLDLDMSYEIDFDAEDWRDTIPEDLIDDWNLEDEYENYKEWNTEEEDEDD